MAFGAGAILLSVGVVCVIVAAVRRSLHAVLLSAGTVGVIAGCAVLTVTGLPTFPPTWEDIEVDGPEQPAARLGDLHIAGGTAREVSTGDVVWAVDNPGNFGPVLVTDDLVVIDTEHGTVAVDPRDGTERWRSPARGQGIVHDGETLVLDGQDFHAVAIDLSDGEIRWQRAGRPIAECTLQRPLNSPMPAVEQQSVLLALDQDGTSDVDLVTTDDGRTTISGIDCGVSARVVGDVLLEADGDDELTGRSISDGKQLWTTSVGGVWNVQGAGPTVVVPSETDATLVDLATGESESVGPPPGTQEVRWTLGVQRDEHVWALSRSGEIHGPNHGTRCVVRDGLITTDRGTFPVV